jgi:hypothetical protein
MEIIGQGLKNKGSTPGEGKEFSLQPRSGRYWGPHNLATNLCGIYGNTVVFSKHFGGFLSVMNPSMLHCHVIMDWNNGSF